MKLRSTFLFFFLFTSLNLFGQVIDPSTLPFVEEYTVVRTNPDADTVILVLHGGPTGFLYEGGFTYLEEIPTFSVVEVKKEEMLNPVLTNDSLTFEEGVLVNDKTAALIEKAVQFYNDQNKIVVLVGHSWGAIILGEYLDDYGVDNIHRIIPMEGRLNMPLDFVNYLLDGFLPTFDADGFSYVFATAQGFYQQGLLTLAAAAFDNRWIDSLANMDLSKMMYTHAEFDMNTGALLPEEIAFLDNSGARTLLIPNGSHADSFFPATQSAVVEFIRTDIMVVSGGIDVASNDLKLYPTLAQNQIQVEPKNQGLFTIVNMMGQPVYQEAQLSHSKSIDISKLSPGHYVGVFESENKGLSTVKFQVIR